MNLYSFWNIWVIQKQEALLYSCRMTVGHGTRRAAVGALLRLFLSLLHSVTSEFSHYRYFKFWLARPLAPALHRSERDHHHILLLNFSSSFWDNTALLPSVGSWSNFREADQGDFGWIFFISYFWLAKTVRSNASTSSLPCQALEAKNMCKVHYSSVISWK